MVVRGLSCSEVRGIFLDQELYLCLLPWQVGSYPLCHREVLHCVLRNEFVTNIWKWCIYNKNNSNFWSLLKIRWFSKTGSIFPRGNWHLYFFGPTAFRIPDQRLNSCPLQWKYRVLTAGPPRNSLLGTFKQVFLFATAPSTPYSTSSLSSFNVTCLPPMMLERLGYCESETRGWGCNLLWVNISSIQILHNIFHLQLGDIYCLPQ